MNLLTEVIHHTLTFKTPAGTSRGTMTEKDLWYLKIWDEARPEVIGIGEVAPLAGLSLESNAAVKDILEGIAGNTFPVELSDQGNEIFDLARAMCPAEFPSVVFGLETALLDLVNRGKRIIFPGEFESGKQRIPINGLVWMGDKEYMLKQVRDKLDAGYDCIKIKVGAIDFDEECQVLQYIRDRHSAEEITIRVDANGAFAPQDALKKLERLAEYEIHSIEQPIRQGQVEFMYELCRRTPMSIALDEELIGVHTRDEKEDLLDNIEPQYIILKPTLHGGLSGAQEWIELAEEREIGWWITSALESNIGLNAIAQFTASLNPRMPQGLGTGQLFENNIDSPLQIVDGNLVYNNESDWKINF